MTKLGLVKNYLKITHDALFGVIACENSNILFIPNRDGNIGSLCVVGFAENVIIWNLKTYQIVKTLPGKIDDKVSYLSYFFSADFGLQLSIGYDSGYVSVYDLSTNYELIVTSKIHKYSISHILHNANSLICGSKDTTITVIDICNESGYKLEGHKSPITKLHYTGKKDVLISSSQDGEIKFWLLSLKRCFKTLTNPSEVWDFFYCDIRNLLITGSNDSALTLWKLDFKKVDNDLFEGPEESMAMTDRYSNAIQVTPITGTVSRRVTKRVVELKVDETGSYLVCNTSDKLLELYKILTDAELKKRLQKKKKKASKTGATTDPMQITAEAEDRLKLLKEIKLPSRCKRVDLHWVPQAKANGKEAEGHLEVLASMHNNTIAVFTVGLSPEAELTVRTSISQCGHRTAIIHCQLTSDELGIFTVSLSEAKLWTKKGLECIATAGWTSHHVKENDDTELFNTIFKELGLPYKTSLDASTALLLPGDRHALIAFKNGAMFLYDLVVVSVIQYLKRHTESISSLVLSSDQMRVLSGGADNCLHVWDLEYSNTKISNTRSNLALVCNKTPTEPFKNAISSLAVTPDGKLFIIGFMDSKIRTYLVTDTSRRVLDLYGHSMPATCLSVKYDSSQLLSGSSDKSVRSWNLPHGDCKIFKGHMEPVNDVQYVPGRSMALSCDKSGLIIQIDLNNMTEILRLRGHGNSVTSLSVVAMGTEADEDELENAEFVSVSTDRSIRLWYESQDILVREVEDIEEQDRNYEKEEMARERIVIVGAPKDVGIDVLTTKTMSTESNADLLTEAIDIYDKVRIYPEAPLDPLMTGKGFTDPGKFVMHTLTKVTGPDLELMLAQLPLLYVKFLLDILADHVAQGLHVSLANRCFLFLTKLHIMNITGDENCIPAITTMAKYARFYLEQDLDVIGFNMETFEYHKKLFGPEFISFTEQRKVKKAKAKKN